MVCVLPQYQHINLSAHGVAVWVLPQNQHKTLLPHGVGITPIPTQNPLLPWCGYYPAIPTQNPLLPWCGYYRITPNTNTKPSYPMVWPCGFYPNTNTKTLFSHGVGITLVPTQNHLTPWCEWLVTQLSHPMEWMQLFVPAHPLLGHHEHSLHII